MTNEEKASQIAYISTNTIVTLENRHTIEVTIEGKIKKAALEMAEWKDKQFRQILRKRWKESQNNPDDKQLKIALFDEIMDIFLGED